jgi:hypothetical protein
MLGAIKLLRDERRCQARMVSGWTIVATSARACLPSRLPISARIFRSPSVRHSQAHVAGDLLTEKPVFC